MMAVTRGHKASAEAAVDGGDERSQGVGGVSLIASRSVHG